MRKGRGRTGEGRQSKERREGKGQERKRQKVRKEGKKDSVDVKKERNERRNERKDSRGKLTSSQNHVVGMAPVNSLGKGEGEK